MRIPRISRIDGLPAFSTALGLLFFAAVCTLFSLAPARAQVSILTQHDNNSRTGANLSETILNTSNVNPSGFGMLFTRPVDAYITAQPLYMPDLLFDGVAHDVVFVATENNSVYAFDADNANTTQPLWQDNLGPSASTGAFSDVGQPTVGVMGTPVIDPSTGTMYVTCMTLDNSGNYHHLLYALDIITGVAKFGSPVEIGGSVAGNGLDAHRGTVTFTPKQQFMRPGLLLSGNTIYIGSASHSDEEPYHGWVFAYNASNLSQEGIFNTSPNGSEGGIWQSGNGLVADNSGNIFVTTGNSAQSTENATGDYGECFIKLNLTQNGLAATDFFKPGNYDILNANDLDLGSGGILEMPDFGYLVAGGKTGIIYITNSSSLGGLNLNTDQSVQEFQACPDQIYSAPVYWNNAQTGPTLYVWGVDDLLRAYSMGHGTTFGTTPSSSGALEAEYPGGSLSISANGNTSGTGILWGAAQMADGSALLAAYDATNLGNLLWTSQRDSNRDNLGTYAKWSPPTIADGKVFIGTYSNQLVVYGLLNGGSNEFNLAGAPNAINVAPGSSATSVITITPEPGFSSSVTLSATGLPTGVSASFSPLSANTQQLTLTASPSAASTFTQFTVTGTAGSISRSGRLRVSVNPQPGMVFGPGLQMISSAYDCSGVALSTLFGIPNPILGVWTPTSSQYALSPNAPADHVRLGQGYWVRLTQQTTLSQVGPPADTTTDFSIPLGKGWNQIGDPFLTPVTLSSLEFNVNGSNESFVAATGGNNPVISPQVWGYDPTANNGTGAYYLVAPGDPIVPGQGYWMDAIAATTLVVPHP